jgi:hypothetical protein
MSLVLLYTLIEEAGPTKLYLIEEPEVHPNPKPHQSFILVLKQVSESTGIQFLNLLKPWFLCRYLHAQLFVLRQKNIFVLT